MDIPEHLKSKYATRGNGATSERAELLQYFMDNVNRERKADGRKELPFGYFASKCTGLQLPDLYYLKSICEDADRRGG